MVELKTKLDILSSAAKYDVSCSSSGSTRKNAKGGVGNGHVSGICHSWSNDGRCISLLKVLFTNDCIYNCSYCVNRITNDVPRATFSPDELAELTINFYKRNYIEGLFLSSAVYQSPDYTMELMIQTIQQLRNTYRFNGYIHMKAIPGADARLIWEAGKLVDRMSVNIELPSSQGLKLLAPQKKKEAIIKPMGYIRSKIVQCKEETKVYKKAPSFVPAGQSTQLIVGATPDHDLKILTLSENLYKRYQLKRVYYSAYVPMSSHPHLPAAIHPPLLREHRLYQADWLLRYYGFGANELLDEGQPDFDVDLDPKSHWALRNLHLFPIEVNRADFSMLLRVPGIGVRSARRIWVNRKVHSLQFEDLKKMGVVLKRARHFITCNGKYDGQPGMNDTLIKQWLLSGNRKPKQDTSHFEQLSLFPYLDRQLVAADQLSLVTGEL